jgi:hypothetical protein
LEMLEPFFQVKPDVEPALKLVEKA